MKKFLVPIFVITFALLTVSALAKDFRITLPKRSKPTPVQQLNRDGVKAIEKHDYDRAKKLFYKAYLLDPDNPFTLNNLGYMAELEGDVDRAQRYYDLSQQQQSDARVAESNSESVVGKTVSQVAGHADEKNLQTNQLNIQALSLLNKDRAPEADVILTKSLALDPKNPFTLNNLGFAKEQEGELEQAFSYYSQAASLRSDEPILVSIHQSWRGKPISEIAAGNADKIRKLMRKEKEEDRSTQVANLNLRGVSALNRNDARAAREYFEQAYKLDPKDAFTLNNMGYVAEMNGDRETAQFYYDKAQQSRRSNDRVTASNRKDAEGRKVASVADTSESLVEKQMAANVAARRAQGPPGLKRREPAQQPNPAAAEPQQQK